MMQATTLPAAIMRVSRARLTPYFVHTLVLGTAKVHGRAETYVEIAKIFKGRH
jgi:hypothetical protein